MIAPAHLPLALALCAGVPAGQAEPEPPPRAPSFELAEAGGAPLELTGYFEDGPFEAAQALVARGATRQAVELLERRLRERPDAAERPQARFLLGLGLIQLGDYEKAARLFDELAVTYPELADDHSFFRGQALFAWGSYLDAAEALSRVDPEGPRGADARRLRARALLRASAFSELVRWLEPMERGAALEPELAFSLARARHRTGDVLGAYRGLREVWREAPAGDLAGPALVHMAELSIGDRGMLAAAERAAIDAGRRELLSGANPDGALAALELRLARGAPEESRRLRAEVVFARGRIAEGAGRLVAAERHFARAVQLAPAGAAELRAKIGLEEGRVAERLGRQERALALFEGVAERFPERREAEDALFHSAEILLSERRYAEARARFEALLLGNPISPHRPRALWGIGWAHFRLADFERARQFFGSLAKMKLPRDLEVSSRYWLARTEASLGRVAEANVLYRRVTREHPLSHYAAFAEDQLAEVSIFDPRAEPGRGAGDTVPRGEGTPRSAPLSKELVQVREYARLGLAARASSALAAYERSARATGKHPPVATLRLLARLYDELGQNVEARRIREEVAREHPDTLESVELLSIARRTHPLKFEAEIRAAATEAGLPDALLFGLIRTESGFRPDAVSNMEALGLAQLILPTARTVSAAIGAGRATRARLLRDPAYNARLGAAYLRSLLDRYGGSEPLALAAYNAGPGAVDAWMALRVRKLEGIGDAGRGVGATPSPDELVEEIPVAETRAFVKTVLARARGYARLYPRAKPPVPEDAPIPEAGALTEPVDLPRVEATERLLARGVRVARPMFRDERAARLHRPARVP